MIAFFHDVELQVAVAVEFHALGGECRKGFAPEIEPEGPFCPVEFGTVEFIVPDQFPLFPFREKAVLMILIIKFLHFYFSFPVKFCALKLSLYGEI